MSKKFTSLISLLKLSASLIFLLITGCQKDQNFSHFQLTEIRAIFESASYREAELDDLQKSPILGIVDIQSGWNVHIIDEGSFSEIRELSQPDIQAFKATRDNDVLYVIYLVDENIMMVNGENHHDFEPGLGRISRVEDWVAIKRNR